VLHDGAHQEPVSKEEISRLASDLKDAGVEAVALCLLHSYADNTQEESVADVLSAAGLPVSVSSRLVNEHASTSGPRHARSMRGGPVVSRYLRRLEAGLDSQG